MSTEWNEDKNNYSATIYASHIAPVIILAKMYLDVCQVAMKSEQRVCNTLYDINETEQTVKKRKDSQDNAKAGETGDPLSSMVDAVHPNHNPMTVK